MTPEFAMWLNRLVRAPPTTWTILQHNGPDHLRLCCDALSKHQMVLITSRLSPVPEQLLHRHLHHRAGHEARSLRVLHVRPSRALQLSTSALTTHPGIYMLVGGSGRRVQPLARCVQAVSKAVGPLQSLRNACAGTYSSRSTSSTAASWWGRWRAGYWPRRTGLASAGSSAAFGSFESAGARTLVSNFPPPFRVCFTALPSCVLHRLSEPETAMSSTGLPGYWFGLRPSACCSRRCWSVPTAFSHPPSAARFHSTGRAVFLLRLSLADTPRWSGWQSSWQAVFNLFFLTVFSMVLFAIFGMHIVHAAID